MAIYPSNITWKISVKVDLNLLLRNRKITMEINGKNVRRQDRKITRRKFISSSAAAATAYTIVPRSVLG
ncbi:hypothetical protein ACFL02_10295, partial [Planctomycetota bacterium]